MSVAVIIFGLGIILLFGVLAKFIFEKTGMPDVLSLVIIGILLSVTHSVRLASIKEFAPIFTSLTLAIILFDGALILNIKSLIKDAPMGVLITIVNFVVSVSIISVILMFYGFDIATSLFIGFALGGVSSSFAIPVLMGMHARKDSFSLLTIESSLTDILCIVFAISTLEFMGSGASLSSVTMRLISLFGISSVIGIGAGIIWLVLMNKFDVGNKKIDTLAVLLIVYSTTEFLGGNGALASLFFGLTLKNTYIMSLKFRSDSFYDEITFIIKTFFFVYIGIMIRYDLFSIIVGTIISVALMISRGALPQIFGLNKIERRDVGSIFGRGIAAAALAQVAVEAGVSSSIENIIYIVIIETILLSSVKIAMARKKKVSYPKIAG